MSLVDWSVIIMGGWTLAIIATGLVMALRPGSGELEYDTPLAEPFVLRQAAGVMPRRAWGSSPAVHPSRYDPAPSPAPPTRTAEHRPAIVGRPTDLKPEPGSAPPPWERLAR